MSAEILIREAQTEGVTITVSTEGKIILSGKRQDREKWAGILKPHRDEVIDLLSVAPDDPNAETPGVQSDPANDPFGDDQETASDIGPDETEPPDDEIDLDPPGGELPDGGQESTPAFDPFDDRRFCSSCLNYRKPRCSAARKIGARPGYEPCQDFPRRCEFFVPLPGDPDQRTGRERWPEFAAPGWTQSADNLLLEAVLDL